MKFLVMCRVMGSGAYCVAFEAYVVNAGSEECAKERVLERYGKHTPYEIQVEKVGNSRGAGIVAEIADEWCE